MASEHHMDYLKLICISDSQHHSVSPQFDLAILWTGGSSYVTKEEPKLNRTTKRQAKGKSWMNTRQIYWNKHFHIKICTLFRIRSSFQRDRQSSVIKMYCVRRQKKTYSWRVHCFCDSHVTLDEYLWDNLLIQQEHLTCPSCIIIYSVLNMHHILQTNKHSVVPTAFTMHSYYSSNEVYRKS